MAKTGDIYGAVEELKNQAEAAYGGLENNDDLDQLAADLDAVGARAYGIRAAVLSVIEGIGELPK